jgi:hypothetical protein
MWPCGGRGKMGREGGGRRQLGNITSLDIKPPFIILYYNTYHF